MNRPGVAGDGSSGATRLCLVRHGETDWNVWQRIQGQLDIPLNPAGQAQARALAAALGPHPFSAVYSSDLGRALETARLIAAPRGLEVRPLRALRERHFGVFQGLTRAEGAARYPEIFARYQVRDPGYDCGGGESLLDLARRVMAGLDLLARSHPGQTLCAIGHAGVLDIVYRRATGRQLDSPRDFAVPNCAQNWLTRDASGWWIDHWADQDHLTPGAPESAE